MSLTDARALAVNLITDEATPELDQYRLRHLALWCLRYSPLVTIRTPDDILIDITGCAHLFGGEIEMMSDIHNRLSSFNLTTQLGLADTIGAAWAAAHYAPSKTRILSEKQRSFLAPLPISALRLNKDILAPLHRLGLRSIQQILDIPTAPLTKRFGPIVNERLQQALGSFPEIFDPLFPPPEYSLAHSFIEPVLYLDGISLALTELTQRLSHLLGQQKKAARRLHLNLFRIDGYIEQISVSTSRPCYQTSHILLLFREKLSQCGEELDAGFGYDLMSLSAFNVETRQDHQSSWNTEESRESESLNRLLDRLGNRFGFDQINYWKKRESHIPERSIQKTSAKNTPPSTVSLSDQPMRPLLLLPHAAPITVLAEVPDGPPVKFEWQRRHYSIIAAEGPERIAPEWWREAPQASFQTRDYYRVEDQNGYRFWIYRDGLYERVQDRPSWFIHGFFS